MSTVQSWIIWTQTKNDYQFCSGTTSMQRFCNFNICLRNKESFFEYNDVVIFCIFNYIDDVMLFHIGAPCTGLSRLTKLDEKEEYYWI